MRRRLFFFTILGVCVIVTAFLGRSYYVHREAALQAREQLQQLPPARAYPNAIQYQGVKDGFHSIVIASLEPTQSISQSALAGSWVITYTGSNPPTIKAVSLTGLVDKTSMFIRYQGFTRPLRPTFIGNHRYVYWELQLDNPTYPFTPEVSRQEFNTSIVRIYLDSGRIIHMSEHPAS